MKKMFASFIVCGALVASLGMFACSGGAEAPEAAPAEDVAAEVEGAAEEATEAVEGAADEAAEAVEGAADEAAEAAEEAVEEAAA